MAPLLIRKWVPGIKPLEINLSKVPLWLHLLNVPLELFNREGLSYIASVIGRPLYMDSISAACKRLVYAKVCVEIDVEKEVPSTVKLVMRDSSISLISVEVPWFPTKCSTCNIFGHSAKTCSKVGKKTWQVKKDLPSKANENLPSSVGNSLAQDDYGNSPQRVSRELLSPTPQGNNGNTPQQIDRVLPSPALHMNSSLDKNGHSSAGVGNPPHCINEMISALIQKRVSSKVVQSDQTSDKIISPNQFNTLAKLDDNASILNEVLTIDDDPNLLNEVLVVDDDPPLIGSRKVRAASAGVKVATQNVEGNRRKHKREKAVVTGVSTLSSNSFS